MTSTTIGNPTPTQPHALKLSTDYISPINAVMVASLTLVDVASPFLDHRAARYLSIVLAVFVLVILWIVADTYRKRPSGEGGGWVFRQVVRSKGFWIAAVVMVLGVGLVYGGKANAKTEDTGVLATIVPSLQKLQAAVGGIQQDTAAIRSDTTAIHADTSTMKTDLQAMRDVIAPADARGQLRTMGFGLDDESKARAIETCDLAALKLYVAAGEKLPIAVPVFGVRGGSVLEKPLVARNARLPEVLDLLAAQGMTFDQPYALTFTQGMTGQIPRFEQLRQRVAPGQRLGLMPSTVMANALTLAIWFDDREAAEKLIALGAKPTSVGVSALLPQLDARGTPTGLGQQKIASAQDEAKRLGHGDWIR